MRKTEVENRKKRGDGMVAGNACEKNKIGEFAMMRIKRDKTVVGSFKYVVSSPFGLAGKEWGCAPLDDKTHLLVVGRLSRHLDHIDLITACADHYARRRFDFVDRIYCDLNTGCDIKVAFRKMPDDTDKLRALNSALVALFTCHGALIGVTDQLVDEISIEYFPHSAVETLSMLKEKAELLDGMDIGEAIADGVEIDGYSPDELLYLIDVLGRNALDNFLDANFPDVVSRDDFLAGRL